jgi:hypothetical protein
MTTIELKKRIIDRIQQIENEDLLKETSRLIELEMEDIESPYELSSEMKVLWKKHEFSLIKEKPWITRKPIKKLINGSKNKMVQEITRRQESYF